MAAVAGQTTRRVALVHPASHAVIRRRVLADDDRREEIEGLRVVEVCDSAQWAGLIESPNLPDGGGPAWVADDDFACIHRREDQRPDVHVTLTALDADAGVPLILFGEAIGVRLDTVRSMNRAVLHVMRNGVSEPLAVALHAGVREFEYRPPEPGDYSILSAGSVTVSGDLQFRVARAV